MKIKFFSFFQRNLLGLSFRRSTGISGTQNGGSHSNIVAEEDTEFPLSYEAGYIEASAINCSKPYVCGTRQSQQMNVNSTGMLKRCFSRKVFVACISFSELWKKWK